MTSSAGAAGEAFSKFYCLFIYSYINSKHMNGHQIGKNDPPLTLNDVFMKLIVSNSLAFNLVDTESFRSFYADSFQAA
jgi:hypothetical protein